MTKNYKEVECTVNQKILVHKNVESVIKKDVLVSISCNRCNKIIEKQEEYYNLDITDPPQWHSLDICNSCIETFLNNYIDKKEIYNSFEIERKINEFDLDE